MNRREASFYASMVGGVLAAVPSHPFDIIKTCQQGDMDQRLYSSAWRTARVLYEEEGMRRWLFKLPLCNCLLA